MNSQPRQRPRRQANAETQGASFTLPHLLEESRHFPCFWEHLSGSRFSPDACRGWIYSRVSLSPATCLWMQRAPFSLDIQCLVLGSCCGSHVPGGTISIHEWMRRDLCPRERSYSGRHWVQLNLESVSLQPSSHGAFWNKNDIKHKRKRISQTELSHCSLPAIVTFPGTSSSFTFFSDVCSRKGFPSVQQEMAPYFHNS